MEICRQEYLRTRETPPDKVDPIPMEEARVEERENIGDIIRRFVADENAEAKHLYDDGEDLEIPDMEVATDMTDYVIADMAEIMAEEEEANAADELETDRLEAEGADPRASSGEPEAPPRGEPPAEPVLADQHSTPPPL